MHRRNTKEKIDAYSRPHKRGKKSGGGFGEEDALATRAGQLDTDKLFSSRRAIADVDNTALSGEVCFVHSGGGKAVSVCGGAETFGLRAARPVLRKRNADLEVRANGHVETRDEGRAVAAEILA